MAQVPSRFLKRIAAELTVDLKVLSVKLSPEQVAENRFARALAVTQFLEEAGQVGTLADTREFVRVDYMPMDWGHFKGWGKEADPGVVLFLGVESELRVALSGSLHHVVGAPAESRSLDDGWFPGSFAVPPPSAYMDLFKQYIEDAALEGPTQTASPHATVSNLLHDYSDWRWRLGTEDLSFIARVTHRFEVEDFGTPYKYLIGSPVWVSRAVRAQ